ncbi:MAG: hypothetical protein U0002_01040 [Thermoanaerobaculia bacterium]
MALPESIQLGDLPEALAGFLLRRFHRPELARRAAFVPLPVLDFESAAAHSHLWSRAEGTSDPTLRAAVERELSAGVFGPVPALERLEEPFFPAPGTGGELQSPYPGVPDDYYWLLFTLHDGDSGLARLAFERPSRACRGLSLAELARRAGAALPAWYGWYRATGGPPWKALGYDLAMRRATGQQFD